MAPTRGGAPARHRVARGGRGGRGCGRAWREVVPGAEGDASLRRVRARGLVGTSAAAPLGCRWARSACASQRAQTVGAHAGGLTPSIASPAVLLPAAAGLHGVVEGGAGEKDYSLALTSSCHPKRGPKSLVSRTPSFAMCARRILPVRCTTQPWLFGVPDCAYSASSGCRWLEQPSCTGRRRQFMSSLTKKTARAASAASRLPRIWWPGHGRGTYPPPTMYAMSWIHGGMDCIIAFCLPWGNGHEYCFWRWVWLG